MRFSPIGWLKSLRTAAALRAVHREASEYARAREIEQSAGAVDPESAAWVRRIARASQTRPLADAVGFYARARRIERDGLSPALADALAHWNVQLLLLKQRFRLVREVSWAFASGASSAEIEDRLSSLDPHDVPEIIALGSEPAELSRLRFNAAHFGECQRLLRSGAVEAESEWFRYRRQAALALLDLIQVLTEARSAGFEGADIVAVISSLLESQDADGVLAIRDEEWPRRRLAKLRRKLTNDPSWRRERSASQGAPSSPRRTRLGLAKTVTERGTLSGMAYTQGRLRRRHRSGRRRDPSGPRSSAAAAGPWMYRASRTCHAI